MDQPRSEGIPYFISDNQEGILIHPGKAEERKSWPQLLEYEEKWKRARRDDSYNLMYVALTRARYANYILLPESEKLTEKEADWIQNALLQNSLIPSIGTPVEFGHTDWYRSLPAAPQRQIPAAPALPLGTARKNRSRVSPSAMTGQSSPTIPTGNLVRDHAAGASFGTSVHAC